MSWERDTLWVFRPHEISEVCHFHLAQPSFLAKPSVSYLYDAELAFLIASHQDVVELLYQGVPDLLGQRRLTDIELDLEAELTKLLAHCFAVLMARLRYSTDRHLSRRKP